MPILISFFILIISIVLLLGPKNIFNRKKKVSPLDATLSLIQGNEHKLNGKQYKFYTELVLKLLQHRREYGAPVKEQIYLIKKIMLKDYQNERVLNKIKYRSWIQFVMISLLTWFFLFTATLQLEIPLDNHVLFIVLFLQILGVVTFNFGNRVWKRRVFLVTDLYVEVLYSMQALIKAGLSINKVESEVRISRLFLKGNNSFLDINQDLYLALEDWKKNGRPISSFINETIEEVWFRYEQKVESFNKGLEVLKFVCLSVFFLGGYFIVISSLFRFFLQGF